MSRLATYAVLFVFLTISVSGCTTHFTSAGQLQWSLTESATDSPPILASFDAAQETAAAGDVTKKSGSSCAGGVCTIY